MIPLASRHLHNGAHSGAPDDEEPATMTTLPDHRITDRRPCARSEQPDERLGLVIALSVCLLFVAFSFLVA